MDPREDPGRDDQHAGRDHVDAAPPDPLGDDAREGAREQDPEQQPRHQASDDTAALTLVGQVGGEGEDDVPAGRGEADDDREHREEHEVVLQRPGQHRHGRDEEDGHDEPSARHDVPERHHEREAGGVTQLDQGDQGRGGDGADVEVALHLVQQGLEVVEVGHDDPDGQGHEEDERRRQGVCREVVAARHAAFVVFDEGRA